MKSQDRLNANGLKHLISFSECDRDILGVNNGN